MAVTVADILRDDVFEDAEVFCGESGLSNIVKRITVFDCKYHEEIVSGGAVAKGDLLLSTLEQFDNTDDNMWEFLKGICTHNSAGLVVLSTGNTGLLTEEVKNWCDEQAFPIIIQKKTSFYIDIMTAVNQTVAADEYNDINLLRLDKLRYAVLSDGEKHTVIRSVNQEFRNMIRAVCLKTEDFKGRRLMRYLRKHVLHSCDTVIMGDYLIIILSAVDEKSLKHHTNAVTSQIKKEVPDNRLGFSRIYPRLRLDKSLDEAMKAVQIAEILNIGQADYDPLLTLPILLAQGNSVEEKDFYKSYVDSIRACVSEEMLPNMLRTIECFVSCRGDYSLTAERLHQHSNTIRYRVNKVRSALGMDDDMIRFYETIAIATKIRILFGYEL